MTPDTRSLDETDEGAAEAARREARSAVVEMLGLVSAVVFSLTFVIGLLVLSDSSGTALLAAGLALLIAPAMPWLAFPYLVKRRASE